MGHRYFSLEKNSLLNIFVGKMFVVNSSSLGHPTNFLLLTVYKIKALFPNYMYNYILSHNMNYISTDFGA